MNDAVVEALRTFNAVSTDDVDAAMVAWFAFRRAIEAAGDDHLGALLRKLTIHPGEHQREAIDARRRLHAAVAVVDAARAFRDGPSFDPDARSTHDSRALDAALDAYDAAIAAAKPSAVERPQQPRGGDESCGADGRPRVAESDARSDGRDAGSCNGDHARAGTSARGEPERFVTPEATCGSANQSAGASPPAAGFSRRPLPRAIWAIACQRCSGRAVLPSGDACAGCSGNGWVESTPATTFEEAILVIARTVTK